MATLHGTIYEAETHEKIDAKVHVLSANGRFVHPPDAILKQGPGTPCFFSDGEIEDNVSRGRIEVLVDGGREDEQGRRGGGGRDSGGGGCGGAWYNGAAVATGGPAAGDRGGSGDACDGNLFGRGGGCRCRAATGGGFGFAALLLAAGLVRRRYQAGRPRTR